MKHLETSIVVSALKSETARLCIYCSSLPICHQDYVPVMLRRWLRGEGGVEGYCGSMRWISILFTPLFHYNCWGPQYSVCHSTAAKYSPVQKSWFILFLFIFLPSSQSVSCNLLKWSRPIRPQAFWTSSNPWKTGYFLLIFSLVLLLSATPFKLDLIL